MRLWLRLQDRVFSAFAAILAVTSAYPILRIRDGQIVEHWGGPHCQEGLGLIR